MIYKHFIPLYGLLFYFHYYVLWRTRAFNTEVQGFLCHIEVFYAKLKVKRLSACFLLRVFSLCSVFRFNPFWVSFCIWCKVKMQLHSFACGHPVFQDHLLKWLFFSLLDSHGTDTKIQLIVDVWCTSGSWNLFHWLIYLSLRQYHTVLTLSCFLFFFRKFRNWEFHLLCTVSGWF